MSKQITNKTGSTKNYAGQIIADLATYTILKPELSAFQAADNLISDLGAGTSTLTDTVASVEHSGAAAVKFLLDIEKRDADGYQIIKAGGLTDPSGLRARIVGSHFDTIAAGTSKNIDWLIPALSWLGQNKQCYFDGVEYCAEGGVIGDKITFQVVDVDGVVYPAGTVLEEFASGIYVMPGSPMRTILYKAKLISGFYIRIKYESTGGVDVKLVCNLFRHLGENENV